MSYTKVNNVTEKTDKERIFQLECEVSMLTQFVIQLIGELNTNGISLSDKLYNPDNEI
jgi:hypothetical protein